jgi:cytochrome P450
MSWARDLQSINPFHHYNIMRPVATKYYRFRMSRFIGKILDNRFAAGQSLASGERKTKTGIDLALELYAKENGERADVSATTMNGEFRQAAIDNLGLLLFAGHDTTASTLCYCYKMLGDNPRALAAARKELDNVFGLDTSAADQLRRSPVLINKLDYTLAVIKEVLRLWSPASTVRAGRKDFFVREPVSGELLPTEGVNIWVQSFSMGRSKKLWGEDADEFKPERFLHGNSANIPADAWRPFERGPRACIGQEFTYLEVKTVLALTLREFDVRCAFDELASLSKDGTFWTKDSSFQSGPQEAFGDPMYQILLATAKPREGMPARVKRRKAF